MPRDEVILNGAKLYSGNGAEMEARLMWMYAFHDCHRLNNGIILRVTVEPQLTFKRVMLFEGVLYC